MLHICPHCKNALPPDALFCGACGKPVENNNPPKEENTASFVFPSVPAFFEEAATPPASTANTNNAPFTAKPTLHGYSMQPFTPSENTTPPTIPPVSATEEPLTALQYFLMMIIGAIPVFGWFYLLLLAINAKTENKRHFAAGMLLFIPVFCLSVFLFTKAFLQGFF